jgi:hypothetical protein
MAMNARFPARNLRPKCFFLPCLLQFTVAALLGGVWSAFATTALEQTFPDLVHRAEVIAIGTVTSVTERWDAQRGAPFTDVTFANLTMLKGDVNDATMTLEFLGGHTPEGTLISVSGVPQFTVGEKNVIFCAGNHKDFCPLVGVWQGRLRVRFDLQRREETISDNFHTPITGVQNGILQKLTPGTPQQPALSLSALRELIAQELQAPYDHFPSR